MATTTTEKEPQVEQAGQSEPTTLAAIAFNSYGAAEAFLKGVEFAKQNPGAIGKIENYCGDYTVVFQ